MIRLKIKKKIFEKKRAKKSLMTEYKEETKVEMSRELRSEPEHEDELVMQHNKDQESQLKIKLEPKETRQQIVQFELE